MSNVFGQAGLHTNCSGLTGDSWSLVDGGVFAKESISQVADCSCVCGLTAGGELVGKSGDGERNAGAEFVEGAGTLLSQTVDRLVG